MAVNRKQIDGAWTGVSHGLVFWAGAGSVTNNSWWVVWLVIGAAMMVTRVVMPYDD